MEIRPLAQEVTLDKGERLEVIVYVDNGGDFLSPVRIVIIGGAGCRQAEGFMSVEDLRDTSGDPPEYFITNRGLIESPML